ncbi:hypothetical protein P3H15_15475 [Rhodococcus sp. T2V]|uniref:hypothetical protein n=1 Tax=Rhodococcus sp. T2V TaxID=3034164 RepID=UPI0023E31AEE|nr:hypothetical protein [Rhodococcus sp. T2V]MDF3306430.1 hypothetical protein [Rhodococcus sp. T2V]
MPATDNDAVLCLAYFHAAPDTGFSGPELLSLRPQLLDETPELDRFDVLSGTARPAAFTMPEEMELTSDDVPESPYDGAFVLGGTREAVAKALDGRIRPALGTVHAYRVAEKVIFDKPLAQGSADDAITFLLSVKWFDDLPESAVRRSWHAHEPLAERVHVGSNRYVQWWIFESFENEAPAIGGIVEMGFPDEESLVTGFFDSPRGELEIVQDSAHFISGGHPRVFVTEHRLHRDAGPVV